MCNRWPSYLAIDYLPTCRRTLESYTPAEGEGVAPLSFMVALIIFLGVIKNTAPYIQTKFSNFSKNGNLH